MAITKVSVPEQGTLISGKLSKFLVEHAHPDSKVVMKLHVAGQVLFVRVNAAELEVWGRHPVLVLKAAEHS